MANQNHLSMKTAGTDMWSIQVQLSEVGMDNALEAAEDFLKQFRAQEPSVPAMLLRELLMAIHRHATSTSAGKMVDIQLIPTGNQKLKMVFKLEDFDFSQFLLTKNDSTMVGLSEREYLLIHTLSERILIGDVRDTLVAEVALPQGMDS